MSKRRAARKPHPEPLDLQDLAGVIAPLELPREDLQAFSDALAKRHPPAVRLRVARQDDIALNDPVPIPWWSGGYWLNEASRPSRSLHFIAGDYYIQDAGSMLALAAIPWLPDLRICDLCAAPGGKATAIADRLGESGWLLANEPIAGRAPALEFNLARTGTTRWVMTTMDPGELASELPQAFDVVLVDAPCSGQTLVGRGKQALAAWSEAQIEHSAKRQQRILGAAAEMLRPGGYLVYSTCTFAFDENERQLEWLLREVGGEASPVPELATYGVEDHTGCYRLWPHRHQTSGSFVFRWRKGDRTGTVHSPETEEWGKHKPNSRALRSRGEYRLETVRSEWGSLRDVIVRKRGPKQWGWDATLPESWMDLASGGPEIAFETGSTWHPSYALAIREDARWQPAHQRDLSDAEALAMMRGASLEEVQRGWVRIVWRARPLFWGKGDGRRLRAVIPPPLRQMTQAI